MILKSALRDTIDEVVHENLEGIAPQKIRFELIESIVDRICVEHEVLDDDEESDDES